MDLTLIKAIWSSKDISLAFVDSCKNSSGILTMWDESKVKMIETLKGGYSLSVQFLTQSAGFLISMVHLITKRGNYYGLSSCLYEATTKAHCASVETSTSLDGS